MANDFYIYLSSKDVDRIIDTNQNNDFTIYLYKPVINEDYEVALVSCETFIDPSNALQGNFNASVHIRLLDVKEFPKFVKISQDLLECVKRLNSNSKPFFQIIEGRDSFSLKNTSKGTVILPDALRSILGFSNIDVFAPMTTVQSTMTPNFDFFGQLDLNTTLGIYIDMPQESKRVVINRNAFFSVKDLVTELNEKLNKFDLVFLENEKGQLEMKVKDSSVSLELYAPIAKALGEKFLMIKRDKVFANFKPMSNEQDVFIECNIIEPQFVNNGCRKVLRKIKSGSTSNFQFQQLFYKHVNVPVVDKINIRLTDDKDNLVSMKTATETQVCLHLRKKRK